MFYFRVDSNEHIAGGHLMRCISIAQELVASGREVIFLIADNNPVDTLENYNFKYTVLDSDWRDLSTDIEQVETILQEDNNPVILVDTYSVTRNYIECLIPIAKVAYLGSKRECLGILDLLINYSADIDYKFYHDCYSDGTLLLLGPQYAPLREEFRNSDYQLKKECKSILLTSGNTNKYGIVEAVIDELLPYLDKYEIDLNVVVGHMFENSAKLYQRYSDYPHVRLLENVSKMSELMKQSDLAISANGTTVYELAAIGLPTISFAMVEEQLTSARALNGLGVVDYCGDAFDDSIKCAKRIKERVEFYINSNVERELLAQKAHQVINGDGVRYICDALLELA